MTPKKIDLIHTTECYPILEALEKKGFFDVKKGQGVFLADGTVSIIEKDKRITREDFGCPTEIGEIIPKGVLEIV